MGSQCATALVPNDENPTAGEPPNDGATTINTGPLVAFIKEVAGVE